MSSAAARQDGTQNAGRERRAPRHGGETVTCPPGSPRAPRWENSPCPRMPLAPLTNHEQPTTAPMDLGRPCGLQRIWVVLSAVLRHPFGLEDLPAPTNRNEVVPADLLPPLRGGLPVIVEKLHASGIRSAHAYAAAFTSIELVTRSCTGLLEASPADEAAGEGDEGVVGFGAAFSADGEAFELVEQDEGLLDDAAELAQALDVRGNSAGDDRKDAAFSQLAAVGVGVVALVAEQGLGASAGPARAAGDGRDAIDQGEGLGDVADVGSGGDDLERGASYVADQVVLAARFPPVDRRRTGVSFPRAACTGCPAGTTGPAPAGGREPSRARAAASARSAPTGHRPRSTAESSYRSRPARGVQQGRVTSSQACPSSPEAPCRGAIPASGEQSS